MNGFPNYGSYFNPFASSQYMNNNMMQMPQQQISNMQAQQMQQQPQMFNNQNMALNQLNGKIVENKDIVSVTEIPVGGYGFFPKADLSEIYLKMWNSSGTTDTIIFRPVAKENPQDKTDTINKILEKIDNLENKVGPISLAIAINGEPIGSSTMTLTPAGVGAFNNVSSSIIIEVPKGCCQTVSVRNISTQAIDVINSNIIIERLA